MKIIYLLTMWALLLMAEVSASAQLRITLNVAAHPDPYLSNWAAKKTTAIVTTINSGTQTIEAKFDVHISTNGAEQARTKPESMRILQIPPGTSQFYGEDLVPYDAVKFTGTSDKIALSTGMLPAGVYEICVSLIHPQSGQTLTQPVCKMFTLTSYQAPILLQPADGVMLSASNRPLFRWSGVTPRPASPATYRVVVMEVLPGQTKTIAFQSNKPILDREVKTTQLMWPADIALPTLRNEYVWAVIATDENGNPLGEPKGIGGPSSFLSYKRNSSGNSPDGTLDDANQGGKDPSGSGNENSQTARDKSKNPKPGSVASSSKDPSDNTPFGGLKGVHPVRGEALTLKDKRPDFSFAWERKSALAKSYLMTIKNLSTKKTYTTATSVLETAWPKDVPFVKGDYEWHVSAMDAKKKIVANSPVYLFSIGPGNSDGTLKDSSMTVSCTDQGLSHICITYHYDERSQDFPLNFSGLGGLSVYPMPGSGTIPVSNLTLNGTPLTTLTGQTLPDNSLFVVCFDVAMTTPHVKVILRTGELDPDPDNAGYTLRNIDTIANPCLCDNCDSTVTQINLAGSSATADGVAGLVKIQQPLTVAPGTLKAVHASLIYVQWEPSEPECLPCMKDPTKWGTIATASLSSGAVSYLTSSAVQWNALSSNNGTVKLDVALPSLIKCCKMKGSICIRYRFRIESADGNECFECDRVVCYTY